MSRPSRDPRELLAFTLLIFSILNNTNAQSDTTNSDPSALSEEDITNILWGVGCIVVVVIVLLVARTCYQERTAVLRERARDEEAPDLIESDNDVVSIATEWDNLSELLDRLLEAHPHNKKLRNLNELLEKTKNEYHCSISLSMPSNPVKLQCEHIFDYNSLAIWRKRELKKQRQFREFRRAGYIIGCPCCKAPFQKEDIKVDVDLQDVLASKLTHFLELVTEANAKDTSATHVHRRNSTRFYSAASSRSNSVSSRSNSVNNNDESHPANLKFNR